MTPEHWRQVSQLYHAALERDASLRASFLGQACGSDDNLRREVDALLADEASAAQFLDGAANHAITKAVEEMPGLSANLVGRHVGRYEILSAIGSGGMGEVYRARDSDLQRDVAIKVLLPAVANDPDRLARFSREARVLASLNHPHIAQIHGFEGAEGVRALVMEMVEGPTLADRIARGALAITDVLAISRQIADALVAAHDQGIVHRDLKPANIKVRVDGTVKVLDFGLAKAFEAARDSDMESVTLPAISGHATDAGMIIGTPAYMSPEQARGTLVDRRADLWAFGAVVYEMLTGRRAFQGDSASDSLAHVLMKEPDWSALPAMTPAPVRRLLRRCLEKDRNRRLDSAADARLDIDDAMASPAADLTPAMTARPPSRVVWIVIGALTAGAAVASFVVWALVLPALPGPAPTSRFAIVAPAAQRLNLTGSARDLALSPDGRYLVYRAGGANDVGSPLMVRAMDQLDAKELQGITSALAPFFSADSQWIGFFENAEMKKVKVTGGPAVVICRVRGGSLGASWGDDNMIVFATDDAGGGLWRVSGSGGEPETLTKPDAARGEKRHAFPSVMPRGRGVLFTIIPFSQSAQPQVAVLDLRTLAHTSIGLTGSQPEYLAALEPARGEPGFLIYAAADTLRGVRFDASRPGVHTDPVTIVDHVRMASTGAANYVVSTTGALVYMPGGPGVQLTPRSLVWIDRNGREAPTKAPPHAYGAPRVSPDGRHVAVTIQDREESDLWIWDVARETLTKFAAGPGFDNMPAWAGNDRIVYGSSRAGAVNLYVQAIDGSGIADRLTTSENAQWPTSVTPDRTRVLGFEMEKSSGVFHVVQFPLPAPRNRSEPTAAKCGSASLEQALAQMPLIGHSAEISPDCRFMAYVSDGQVWVRPFPDINSHRWQVSKEGGRNPVWARNGRELFYIDNSDALLAVRAPESGATFAPGAPAAVFETKIPNSTRSRGYDVAPGGRFMIIKDSQATDPTATPASLVVVLNWFELLKLK